MRGRHRRWTLLLFLLCSLLLPVWGTQEAAAQEGDKKDGVDGWEIEGDKRVPGEEQLAGAAWHVLRTGDRGEDVRALQYLLRFRGYSLTADGQFGPGTDSAVRAFQQSQGLGVDGIVGNATWDRLVPTIRTGDNNDAVRALQAQLNAKRGTSLTVDGVFGSGTASAVTTFQQHMGIGADGIVGPTTWKNLIWHFEQPTVGGSLCGYYAASKRWGTSSTVGALEYAGTLFASQGAGAIPIGDISLEHGGPISGHASHQVGLDVDLRPIRKDRTHCANGTQWNLSTYDQAKTRELVQDLLASGHVKIIWFNDPVLINEGLTHPLDNHDNHLHVRYCTPSHPDSRYRC